jgi:NAD(P)-dependent dehydrogenase (short-subunit alcohol dehydrogenase family)
MIDLSGRTALVTGSVQGIGLAIAEALAGAGARIALHGLAGRRPAARGLRSGCARRARRRRSSSTATCATPTGSPS